MAVKKEVKELIRSIQFYNPGLEKEIIKAFTIIDRKFFVKENPYLDMPQDIAHGQTISQPTTIAKMLRVLQLEKNLDILEIGTNTGYHATLASWLVYPGTVYTIEIFPDLAQNAKKNIANLKKKITKTKKLKIEVFAGDALNKKTPVWKNNYDRIYFTASVEEKQVKKVHEMAKKLLKQEGMILYPTRELYYSGALELWQLKGKELELKNRFEGYAFVPLLDKSEFKGKVEYKLK